MEERRDPLEEPLTAPAGIRLVPPGMPPAPPGTGTPPPTPPVPPPSFGGGGESGFFQEFSLGVGYLGLIRSARETSAGFEGDNDLAQEMHAVISTAKRLLLGLLDSLAVRFVAEAEGFEGMRMGPFRRTMESLASAGVTPRWADRTLNTHVFTATGGESRPLRRYWFLRGSYIAELREALPHHIYCAELMKDLYVEVNEVDPVRAPKQFLDAFRDYLVVQLAVIGSQDPGFTIQDD